MLYGMVTIRVPRPQKPGVFTEDTGAHVALARRSKGLLDNAEAAALCSIPWFDDPC